jgi:hypothetical protein
VPFLSLLSRVLIADSMTLLLSETADCSISATCCLKFVQ